MPPGVNDTLRCVLAEDEALLDGATVDRALADGGRTVRAALGRAGPSSQVCAKCQLADRQVMEPGIGGSDRVAAKIVCRPGLL